nr:SOS response-associated peptidase family protein [Pseudorhodobacter sp.]
MWRGEQHGLPDDDAQQLTHTIITTTANDIVRPIHPTRMPVILQPRDYEEWLTGSPEDAERLMRPFPDDQMEIVQRGEGLKADEA